MGDVYLILGASQNSRKYCAYHQASGHDTNDCVSLKDFIERKVQDGALVHYVAARTNQQQDRGPVQAAQPVQQVFPAPGPPARQVIDVITGGTSGKLVGKKRRSYLDSVMSVAGTLLKTDRPFPGTVISFTNEDYPSKTIEPHEGSLVVTAQVGSVDMKRMMIDNGSSVDILYAHAYQRMHLDGQKMEIGHEAPLYGFSNDPVKVAGTIELPVIFGTAPQQVEIICKFYVVHVDSAYNAILGRPTLTAL